MYRERKLDSTRLIPKVVKMKEPIVDYLDKRDQMGTFTIVNCVHRKFPYNLIGHTAVIYKCGDTGQLMVFESTTLNKATGIQGVQLTPFGIWLHNYPGKVYIRIPKFDSTMDIGRAKLRANKFVRDNLGTSYPNLKSRSGRFKLYMAALDFKLFGKDWFTYKGNDSGIFCTELVVLFLYFCGLWVGEEPANEFQPDDFRQHGVVTDWHLNPNVKLGNEIRIK